MKIYFYSLKSRNVKISLKLNNIQYVILSAVISFNLQFITSNLFSQNISINTTGVAAASTNMLEVLQINNTDATVGFYVNHSGGTGGAGTRYALQAINNGASLNNIAAYLSASGGTNNYGLIVAAGNVGIGTTSPGFPLDISTFQTTVQIRSTGGESNQASLQFMGGAANAQWSIGTNSSAAGAGAADNLYFQKQLGTAGIKMVIQDNGNVGIGLTAPASLLHSAGQIRTGIPLGGLGGASATTGSLLFYNSATANTVNIQSGTTSASYTLTLPTAQASGTQVLSNTGGVLSWANDANSGGTVTSVTASSPLTSSGGATPNILLSGTAGGVAYGTGVGTGSAFTAAGTSGQVLTSAGTGTPTWTTPSSGGAGVSVMYLKSYYANPTWTTPAACPAGWTQADAQTQVSEGPINNYVRTCYRTDISCQVMVLKSQYTTPTWTTPAACPAGWTQADAQQVSEGPNVNYIRTCYLCH